jgi:DNA-directed RNA polymerase specialized sigma subunit
MATHYVNNAEMLESIKSYKAKLKDARDTNTEEPRIPEYLGECVLKIATRLSQKANFINYSYRDDMILDGIENCIQCMNSFDPNKSSNPFSYFTQVIYFAFLRRIAKEKKQSYIKGKLVQEMAFDTFDIQGHDDDSDFKNAYASFIQMHSTFDDSFIKNKEKKKKIKEDQSLENFFDSSIIKIDDDNNPLSSDEIQHDR